MSNAELTDEQLVERVRAGDQAASRTLFDRISPVLQPWLRRRMGGALRRKVGESDLIQSAFAAVIERLTEFEDRGEGSFVRWVAGILHHKLFDELRRYDTGKRDLGREGDIAALPERIMPRAPGATPSQTVSQADERRRIRAAIELLSPDHQTVVRLMHETGLSQAEAARSMGKTPDAVQKLYLRAVARLTALLRKEEASS